MLLLLLLLFLIYWPDESVVILLFAVQVGVEAGDGGGTLAVPFENRQRH